MHDQTPNSNPGHEGEETGSLGDDNVVDRIREDRYRTSHPDDHERLSREEGEDDTAQN